MTHRRTALQAAALAAGLAALGASGADADAVTASAELAGPDGEDVGSVTLREWPAGVLVELRIDGMQAGEHAVHIHETGACAPDFSAAGDHFAPQGNDHGFKSHDGPHAGDLPSVFVSVDGSAAAHFLNTRITLTEGGNAILDEDGAAIIVHAQGDSYEEKSRSGDRIACGVIGRAF